MHCRRSTHAAACAGDGCQRQCQWQASRRPSPPGALCESPPPCSGLFTLAQKAGTPLGLTTVTIYSAVHQHSVNDFAWRAWAGAWWCKWGRELKAAALPAAGRRRFCAQAAVLIRATFVTQACRLPAGAPSSWEGSWHPRPDSAPAILPHPTPPCPAQQQRTHLGGWVLEQQPAAVRCKEGGGEES